MTTPKKTTGQTKEPVKRVRKKAEPKSAEDLVAKQDLFGGPAPPDSVRPDSAAPPEACANEARHRIASAPDGLYPPTPSMENPAMQLPASPPVPAEAGFAPEDESLARSGLAGSGREQVAVAGQTWLLVTNHLNALYLLAAGMVMGPAGFAGKHYRDPSSEVPGLIPVFRDGVPEAAVQQAVSEEKYLRPCIVQLDLARIAGPAGFVSQDGVVSSGALPCSIDSKTAALLVPAPLPMTLVKRLTFRSSADRKEFETAARNFANIDLTGLSIEVSERYFSSTRPAVWPLPGQPEDHTPVVVDQAPARGAAIGSGLAMLYQLANRSDLCASAYRIASGAGTAVDYDAVRRDPVLAELAPWMESGCPRPESPVQARLFWGAIQALVDARLSGSPERPVDTVLGYLDGQRTESLETGHQPRLERLISDMRSTFGLGGGTISRLFEHHKGTLSRPLLLFCLRERCVDLLEFSHPDLRDEELVLAAILFGVRDGWIGLPVELRTPKGLARFVEHRMFEAEGSQRNVRLSLDQAPPRPIPLRELLTNSEVGWNEARRASLAELANRLGWHDCIVSRIRLSQGQYRLNVSDDGIEVLVRGNISPPIVEIDRAGLLKKISQWPPMPRDEEDELRAALDSRG